MPLVSKPCSLACRAERLAREAGGPDGEVVGNSGLFEREAPDSDAGAQVHLPVSGEFVGPDVPEVSGIDFSIGNQSILDEFTEPRSGKRVKFDIERGHFFAPAFRSAISASICSSMAQ